MKAKVESLERLSDGGMIAHVTWFDGDGNVVLVDHVRLPEWDDLGDDAEAQTRYLVQQLAERQRDIVRREQLRRRVQQRYATAVADVVGTEILLDQDGNAYIEVVERRRMRLDEYLTQARSARQNAPEKA